MPGNSIILKEGALRVVVPESHSGAVDARSNSQRGHINSLTGLRFFAALSLVVLHFAIITGGAAKGIIPYLALRQGVAFFYLLSGFILFYVYPQIPSTKAAQSFIVARFARLWPAHIVGLLLAVFFVKNCFSWSAPWLPLAANVTMTHDWFLIRYFYFSGNPVSWSISCELFFYLCFFWLIRDFETTWARKWLISALLLSGFAAVCVTKQLSVTADDFAIGANTLLNTNPLARLLEFVSGMVIALAFSKRILSERMESLSAKQATAMEGAAILIALCALASPALFRNLFLSFPNLQSIACLIDTTFAIPFYGLLIFVFAHQKGYFSKLLASKLFYNLGEHSYSLYLLHFPIISFLFAHSWFGFSHAPKIVLFASTLVGLCVLSYLNFEFVEKPSRKAIRKALAA